MAKKIEQNIQEVEITIPVRVEMSEAEKERSAKALAEAVEVNKTLLEERTAIASDYNNRINENRGVMNREAGIVKRGFQEVETKCIMEYDRTAGLCRIRNESTMEDGTVFWVEETWREVSRKERTLADAAMQPDIPGTESPAEAAADLDASE